MIRGLVFLLMYVGEKFLSTAFKKLLLGAGLGLVSFGLSQSFFSILLNYVNNQFQQLSGLFYLIDLAGVDVAISYILSAISIRITMDAGKLSIRKLQ